MTLSSEVVLVTSFFIEVGAASHAIDVRVSVNDPAADFTGAELCGTMAPPATGGSSTQMDCTKSIVGRVVTIHPSGTAGDSKPLAFKMTQMKILSLTYKRNDV